jgi:hypothetical protein
MYVFCVAVLFKIANEIISTFSRMFEELLDIKKMINPESYNPTKLQRPNLEPALQYEDTPEFRQSLNMKVCALLFFSSQL